ncbi:Nif3-like dinuclear metal center hexameric protein [Patescibacteria group bacterium]|nr:Nif3-like dinuclear metal center hexameric protein [Patescibacteria group bacterium]
MKIKDIFDLALKMGIDADLRGRDFVEKELSRKKEKYEKLQEKEDFDQESLVNPYSDTRILNVSEDKDIKKTMVGIDIDPAEILMAKELGIDLIISHHPLGKALANLAGVMSLQCDVLNLYGVPINVAEGLMHQTIGEVARGVNAKNHQRTIDAARLMNQNLICLHTVCDNMAAKFLKDFIEKSYFHQLEDLIKALKQIPEYKEASKIGVGPKIFSGSPESRCGKIAITEVTGGAEGSPKLYEKMANAGIGTIIGMHVSEEHKKEAEAANVNIVIAGHMSSDSLGVNLFLDELEKKGIEIIPCSGLIRVKRGA